ncbi:MAG: 16S rRNA (uracil(1498)-N(3))-methyltransferase [Candidatus Nanopelagicales bacterium]
MSASVFLVEPASLAQVGDTYVLDGPEGRHAVAVSRIAIGERIHVVDGEGTRVVGTVREYLGKDACVIAVESVERLDEPSPRLIVVQALPKSEHGELAVDLLTQAGADVIVPWAASRCVTQWRGDRAEKSRLKWVQAARAATKQSRRARAPQIRPVVSLADVLDLVASTSSAFVLHEEATALLGACEAPTAGDIVLVVGPEGGISPEEITALTGSGARAVLIGATVLRSSSAGSLGIAALMSRSPSWTGQPMGGSAGE